MRDFTLPLYRLGLKTILGRGFSFTTVSEYIKNSKEKCIILRHDVDRLPANSFKMAQIEHEFGIKASYYFRIVPASFDESIIDEIACLGHEIGYHYEDFAFAKGNVDNAYLSFCRNLEKLRKIYPVKTICMHGSPFSKYDNRAIWDKYDYKKLGIVAEPYFDIDFNKVFYLTDTGRMWDGDSFNIRDKGTGNRQRAIGEENRMPRTASLKPFPKFHSTFDIISAAERGELPDKIMITIHPQRWTDKPLPWVKELVWQNVKNVGKYFLVKWRDKEEVRSEE